MSEHKFIRDNVSKAVLNTDVSALEQYKFSREQRMNEQIMLKQCINDVNTLKDDMTEIKNLLLKLSEN
jgi:regulatory protein YycI of two-component signal transduction system YycFG